MRLIRLARIKQRKQKDDHDLIRARRTRNHREQLSLPLPYGTDAPCWLARGNRDSVQRRLDDT